MDQMPCINEDLAIVKNIIESGTPIDKKYGPYQETLLIHAIKNKYNDIVKYLVEAGANVNLVDGFGIPPLNIAVEHNTVAMVKYLLMNGSVINYDNDDQHVPVLNYAVYSDNIEMVRFLVESGANVDSRSKQGNTPLHSSVYRCDHEIVKYLLSVGADKSLVNRDGQTAVMIAKYKGFDDLAGYIESYESMPVKGVHDD